MKMGDSPHIVEDVTRPPAYPPAVIVLRARGFLGARDYRMVSRNCQSFVTHCVYGTAFTDAVQRAGLYVGGAIMALGLCVIVAAYELSHTPWR